MTRTVSLILRNLVFTVVVPGLGGVWLPWLIMTRGGHTVTPSASQAVPVIAVGAALYAWCVWNFAAVGGGTPGPWDAPARVVAAGPYRWVRNPIYLAALLIVLGEAWLFLSPRAGRLRGRDGAVLPPVHHRLRGTHPGPALRPLLPGLPGHGPALDPAPPQLTVPAPHA